MFLARRFALVWCLLLTTVALAATLKSVLSFDLPGPAGKRFDYLTIDYDDHYLLSAHLAAGLLYVIDLRTDQVVKAIPDVPGAGALPREESKRPSAPRARRPATLPGGPDQLFEERRLHRNWPSLGRLGRASRRLARPLG